MLAEFDSYLRNLALSKEALHSWETVKPTFSLALAGTLVEQNDLRDAFFDGVKILRQQLNKQKAIDKHHTFKSAGFWLQITNSLVRMVEVQWGIARFEEHDDVMVDNVTWMLNGPLKNKKVIISGHYIHLNKAGGFIGSLKKADQPPSQRKFIDNLTSKLAKTWKDEIYVLNINGAHGEYVDFRDMKKIRVAQTDAPLYRNVDKDRSKVIYLNLNTTAKGVTNNHIVTWGHEYLSLIPIQDWHKHWDGIIFLDKLTPVNYISP